MKPPIQFLRPVPLTPRANGSAVRRSTSLVTKRRTASGFKSGCRHGF